MHRSTDPQIHSAQCTVQAMHSAQMCTALYTLQAKPRRLKSLRSWKPEVMLMATILRTSSPKACILAWLNLGCDVPGFPHNSNQPVFSSQTFPENFSDISKSFQ